MTAQIHRSTGPRSRTLVSALAAVVLCLSAAAAAAQSCNRPTAPSVPNGAAAEQQEMVDARAAVEAYLDAMQKYVDCLQAENKSAADEADDIVSLWNRELQAFQNK